MDKSPDAFRTIREVAESMDLPQHVLRFWETRFPQIKPLKRGGGRRYYRPDDVELLRAIRHLLYGEGYTIKGVQKLIKEQGARAVAAGVPDLLSAERGAAPSVSPSTQEQGGEPQFEDFEPAPARIQPGAARMPADPRNGRGILSPEDFQALRGALQDIVEGERILSLARANSPD
jgi:DNA-binding transcriptional MerR regulator